MNLSEIAFPEEPIMTHMWSYLLSNTCFSIVAICPA